MIESVIRETSLEGRINIFVAPEGNGTRITVKCQYIFKVNISGDYVKQNMYGGVKERGPLPSSLSEIIFDKDRVKRNNREASGKLEQEILSLHKQ